MDPIAFGVIIVLNVVIGLITPPVAPGLVTYIPALSTWLPMLFRD